MAGNLRDKSGILNPVIGFQFGSGGGSPSVASPNVFNYAYIYQFGYRHYFIREWEYEAGIWWAYMEVDVLATWKSNIGASTLYVLRAANAFSGRIVDTLYPSKVGCDTDVTQTATDPWLHSDGVFSVGVVNAFANFGSLDYYILTTGQLAQLCAALLTDVNNNGVVPFINDNKFSWQGVSDEMLLSLCNPIQYIKSCVYLPISAGDSDFHDLGSSTSNIKVFNWSTNTPGIKIKKSTYIEKTNSLAVIKHPDAGTRGYYMNCSPYTSLTLTIPPFGSIDIDTSVTCNDTSVTPHPLSCSVRVDPLTGKGVLTVRCHNVTLHRIESQVGVPISLSQVTRDYIGAATGAAGAIGSVVNAAQGGFIGSAISGVVSGIGNAVESMMPRASTIGTTGSFVSNYGRWRLDHQFFTPVNDDLTHHGRPLCENRQISTLGDYMLIQDGDVSIGGTLEEAKKIKQYLETGFYYE